MQFKPLTGRLFTDGFRLLKKLHCPHGMKWEAYSLGGANILVAQCRESELGGGRGRGLVWCF